MQNDSTSRLRQRRQPRADDHRHDENREHQILPPLGTRLWADQFGVIVGAVDREPSTGNSVNAADGTNGASGGGECYDLLARPSSVIASMAPRHHQLIGPMLVKKELPRGNMLAGLRSNPTSAETAKRMLPFEPVDVLGRPPSFALRDALHRPAQVVRGP
jgi:hypothetical protein